MDDIWFIWDWYVWENFWYKWLFVGVFVLMCNVLFFI